MPEQPRVPAGTSEGGQWTSTHSGGGTSASVARGDWAEQQQQQSGNVNEVTQPAILTAEEGGEVTVLRKERFWDTAPEIRDFTAKLDPSRRWHISVHDDKLVAKDLGSVEEHDRLMGGSGLRRITADENREYDDKELGRSGATITVKATNQPLEGLPKSVAGIDYIEQGISSTDLARRATLVTTPAVAQAQAAKEVDRMLSGAFKDIPEDYTPGWEPYNKTPGEIKAWKAEKRAAEVAAVQRLRTEFGSPEGLKQHIEAGLRESLRDSSPGMVMNNKTLGAILDGEPVKNYLETAKSSVSAANKSDSRNGYLLRRTMEVDAKHFGIPIDAPGSERPVHGLILPKGSPEDTTKLFVNARQYGGRSPVLVEFHDDIKKDATVTMGDSLDIGRRPVSYSDPTIHAIAFRTGPQSDPSGLQASDVVSRFVDKTPFATKGPKSDAWYDEVQYHRRPTAKDIKHVTFAKEPSSSVKKKLAALGATWSVANLPEE